MMMKHLLCERSWNGLHSFNCVNKKLGKVRRRCGGRWESLVQASRGHFVFAFAIWTALSVAQRSRPSWLGSAVANPDHGPGDRFNGKHWTPALQLKGKGIFNQSNVAHKKQCRVDSFTIRLLTCRCVKPCCDAIDICTRKTRKTVPPSCQSSAL